MTQDLYPTKRSLELEWQQEYLKEGKYNINMSYIDKKIQEVVKEIIAKEFEQAIIDKLGEKRIKWESTGMFRDARRITYEEVKDDRRPIQTKTVLGVEVAVGV